MPNALTLHEVLSRPTYRSDYARAKARQTCIVCGRPAVRFRDLSARFEYTVSALCQQCQDQFLYSKRFSCSAMTEVKSTGGEVYSINSLHAHESEKSSVRPAEKRT